MSETPTPPDVLLEDVLSRYDATENPRLKEIVTAAIRHLHAFATEVRLQRDEWMAGIEWLTAAGKICDGVRQEFILMSDTFGVSTLVELLTQQGSAEATPNTVLGPFYVPGSPHREFGESMLEVADDPGDRVVVRGTVRSADGTPLPEATLDCWQNSSGGAYAVQAHSDQPETNLRGVYAVDTEGRFEIRGVRPSPYTVPDDGPVGALMAATERSVWRPGHLHMFVRSPGHKDLITHIFDAASTHLDDDAVFGVRDGLTVSFTQSADGEYETTFDLVLDPA